MNILFAIDSFYGGGAEIFAIRLANGFSRLKQDKIYFVALRPWLTPQNQQKSLLDHNSLEYISLTGTWTGDLFFGIFLWIATTLNLKGFLNSLLHKRIRYICNSHKIDLVNSHSYESDHAFAMVKGLCKFKLVTSFHGHYELFENSWRGFEESCDRLLKDVDAVVYLSPKHIETLDRYHVPKAKRHKIFYGFDMEPTSVPTQFAPDQSLKLLMVARGIKEKGWAEFLQAVEIVSQERGSVLSVQLIGEGAFLEQLQPRYQHLPFIEFVGFQKDVLPFVKNAHICVLPSYYMAESLPNSVIEYLMCGKPVITTEVGAIPEMLNYKDQLAGQVLTLKNGVVSIHDISSSILMYLNNPFMVEQQSQVAIKASEKFRMATCVDNYYQLFVSL